MVKLGVKKGIMMPFANLAMDKYICYVQRNIQFSLQSQAMERPPKCFSPWT